MLCIHTRKKAMSEHAVQQEKAASQTVSKKKYKEFKDVLETSLKPELVNYILTTLCDVLAFDPDKPTYTHADMVKTQEWRRRKMEETGQSSYVVSGEKARYQARRARKTT